ncbi:MAG: glycosyltransferase [Acidimicrobiales bacterium]
MNVSDDGNGGSQQDLAASIVILAWNAWETTRACLESLRPTLRDRNSGVGDKAGDEVIVVDNGSTDGTREYLGNYPWVKLVRNDRNLGFAAGNNAGAAIATRPLVVFLNNDTVLAGRWLDALVFPFSDPLVGATGPRSNYVTGPQLIPDVAYEAGDMLSMRHFAATWSAQHSGEVEEVEGLIGFCLAVRRSTFEALGGFDESFGVGGFEDNDLCMRMRSAGWKLCIPHGSFVHHEGHRTFEANGMDWYTEQQRNRSYFMSKHAPGPGVGPGQPTDSAPPSHDDSYYHYDRPEVLARIPLGALRVLELGCAAGRLAAALKVRQQCQVIGIEKEPQPAKEAANLLDEVIVADIQEALGNVQGTFDAVVAADVLEHLEDPWGVVQRCAALLRPGGVMVASVPNIANLEVIAGLASGRFPYADAGILDRGHLRFFTRASIKGMLMEAGLTVESLEAIRDPQFSSLDVPHGTVADITIGDTVVRGVDVKRLEELCAVQFLVTARKRAVHADRAYRPKIYDCFPFFNEVDMLDARVEEMARVVDVFAVSESTLTHSGIIKPLVFPDCKERFARYGKDFRYIVADLPADGAAWERKASQRDALISAVQDADPDDLVICCDLDEIVDSTRMDEIIAATSTGPVSLAMPVYYYSLSWRSPQRWIHSKAFRVRDLPASLSWLRLSDIVGWGELPVVENAGWHLSYFGGSQKVHEKLSSFAHCEYDTSEVHATLDDLMEQGITIHGMRLERVEDSFPEHIRRRFQDN